MDGVGEGEWLDTVLQDVWEGEEAALRGCDAADFLHGGALVFAAEDGGDPFVVALLVVNVSD